jgi:Co/Zn/Cd efflux system component
VAILKRRAALFSGVVLALLGAGVLVETARRWFVGSEPEGVVMLAVAVLALGVNATVLYLLRRYREGEIHLRASWIFTRADVIANLGVITAGSLVLWTASRLPDLIIGCAIGVYVLKEAYEILREARSENDATPERCD